MITRCHIAWFIKRAWAACVKKTLDEDVSGKGRVVSGTLDLIGPQRGIQSYQSSKLRGIKERMTGLDRSFFVHEFKNLICEVSQYLITEWQIWRPH